jgi:hypothetical protein
MRRRSKKEREGQLKHMRRWHQKRRKHRMIKQSRPSTSLGQWWEDLEVVEECLEVEEECLEINSPSNRINKNKKFSLNLCLNLSLCLKHSYKIKINCLIWSKITTIHMQNLRSNSHKYSHHSRAMHILLVNRINSHLIKYKINKYKINRHIRTLITLSNQSHW